MTIYGLPATIKEQHKEIRVCLKAIEKGWVKTDKELEDHLQTGCEELRTTTITYSKKHRKLNNEAIQYLTDYEITDIQSFLNLIENLLINRKISEDPLNWGNFFLFNYYFSNALSHLFYIGYITDYYLSDKKKLCEK